MLQSADEEERKMIPFQLQDKSINFVLLKEKDKIPMQTGWQKKEIKYDDKELINHIEEGGNYGVRGGGEKNLIIVDFDNEEVQKQMCEKLPNTFTVKTGGGLLHKYFWTNDNKSYKIFAENMDTLADVQAEGKQVVGANSIHPNGNEYNVVDESEIAFIDYVELKALVMSFDRKPNKEVKEYTPKEYEGNNFIEEVKSRSMLSSVLSDFGVDTSKNPTNCPLHSSKGGKCFGFNNETWHCFHCEESGNVFSAVMKFKNVEFKEALEYLVEMNGMRKEYDENKKKYLKSIQPQEIDFLILKKVNEKTGKKEYAVNIDAVADYIIDEFNPKTIFGSKNETIYIYDGRIYVSKGRAKIKVRIEELLEKFAKTNTVNEIVEKIKRKTEVEREEFENLPTHLIPFENGVYNVQTKQLEDHSKENNFTFILPIKFETGVDCPKFKKFIEEVLYPEDIPVIQEWFGFCLFRQYFIKKAVICVGDRDTGKTVLLETLINFIGERNKTGLPLQKISAGNDFVKLSLKDKHLNAYDDLSSQDINDGGGFKVATGGGTISAEEKFGDFLQFRPYAKQTFCANKIPPVKDNEDPAYFGRWIILQFDNVADVKDPFLKQKLNTPEEKSGILNWALEGLFRLLDKGEFSYTKTPDEIKTIMEMSGNPYVAFANDCLNEEQGAIVSKDDMITCYNLWAKENKRRMMSKEMLGRNLHKNVYFISNGKSGERKWENVQIKLNWRDKLGH